MDDLARIVEEVVAAVRRSEGERRPFVFDESVWTVREGAIEVRGDVLVESQALAYRLAFLKAGIHHAPSPRVKADLRRGFQEFRWLQFGASWSDLRREPGGALQTQAPPGSFGRILVEMGESTLVQIEDGTVGWINATGARELELDADPWRGVRLAEGQSSLQSADVEQLSVVARSWLGVPYRLGGASRTGIDCSGFAQSVVRQAWGIVLPKHTTDQARCGERVGREAITAGDLLFTLAGERNVHHEGLVIHGAAGLHAIHACMTRGAVIEESLDEFLSRYRFSGARRLWDIGRPSRSREARRGRGATTMRTGMYAEEEQRRHSPMDRAIRRILRPKGRIFSEALLKATEVNVPQPPRSPASLMRLPGMKSSVPQMEYSVGHRSGHGLPVRDDEQ